MNGWLDTPKRSYTKNKVDVLKRNADSATVRFRIIKTMIKI